jgi:hypothetical protein
LSSCLLEIPDTIQNSMLSELLSQWRLHDKVKYPPSEPILLWAADGRFVAIVDGWDHPFPILLTTVEMVSIITATCASRAMLKSTRSTNPIWRLGPVFGQLGWWNEKTMLVIVGNGAVGRKCEGWSMNSKPADWRGRSFAEGGIWR